MTGRGHLREDRLFDCYLADRHGDPVDLPTAEHLADCPACRARYDEVARFMDVLREESEAEADALFTPERLEAQALHVAHRLEHLSRPARVINFPSQFAKRTIMVPTSHAAPRWVAAAAAAGIFIGAALGASYQGQWRYRPARGSSQAIQSVATQASPQLAPLASASSIQSADIAADDEFLSELEIAADRPRSRELLPFDALTPHVREIVDIR